MPEWKDLKSAFTDSQFHELPLEDRRKFVYSNPDIQSVSDITDTDVDKMLSDAYKKYYIPTNLKRTREKIIGSVMGVPQRFTEIVPPPPNLKELFQDKEFHLQPIEKKIAQTKQVDPNFGEIDKNEQEKILKDAQAKYKNALPPPPKQKIKPMFAAPEETLSQKFLNSKLGESIIEFGYGVRQGTKSTLQGVGGAMGWVGSIVGSDTIREWGRDTNQWLDENIDVVQPPAELAGSVMEKPWLLTDPRWWARNIGSLLPFAASFAVSGVGAVSAARAILGAAASAKKIMALASALNAINNALFVGSSQYVDEIKAGRSNEEASKSASLAFSMDAPWTFITGMPLFSGAGKGIIKNAIKNMLTEGVQESGEQYAQNLASVATGGKRDLSAGVAESAILGGIAGPVIGGAIGNAMQTPTPESITTLQKQVNAVKKGNRPYVMFQEEERTPEKIDGLERLDYHIKGLDKETGDEVDVPSTFFYNPKKTSSEVIISSVDSGNYKSIGYVDKKSPQTTHVVAVIDKNGNELSSKAVTPEHIQEQKKIEQEHFPATDPDNDGTVIVSGPIDVVTPILDNQRQNSDIDNTLDTKEKIDDILSGKEEAPNGVIVEKNIPVTVEEKTPEVTPLETRPQEEPTPIISPVSTPEEISTLPEPPETPLVTGQEKRPPKTVRVGKKPVPVIEEKAPEPTTKIQKQKDIISSAAKQLDFIPEGTTITDSKGNTYTKREGGWKKKDKNGKEVGRTILSATIAEGKRIQLSKEEFNRLWEMADRAKKLYESLPPPPEVEEELPPVDKGELPKDSKVSFEAMPQSEQLEFITEGSEHLQSPEDILLQREAEEAELTPPPEIVVSEKPKTIKVLKKKAKTIPPPPIIEPTPVQKIEPHKPIAEPTTITPPTPIKPILASASEALQLDIDTAITQRDKAVSDLAEVEAEGLRRMSGDAPQGKFYMASPEELMSIKNRLVKVISKLNKNIEGSKSKLTPPPESQTLEPSGETPRLPTIPINIQEVKDGIRAAKNNMEAVVVVEDTLSKEGGQDILNDAIVELENDAKTPEELIDIENRLDEVLGPIEEKKKELTIQEREAPLVGMNEPQYAFGLPPKKEAGPRNIQVKDSNTGKMLGLRGIVVQLAKSLDVPIRFNILAKGAKKGALELFRPLQETIHLNPDEIAKHNRDEVDAMSHAVGHYFDLLAFRDGKSTNLQIPSFGVKFDSELMGLGEQVLKASGIDPKKASTGLIRNEGIADFFRRYLTEDRALLRNDANNFFDMVEETLEKYPVIDQILERATMDIDTYNKSSKSQQIDSMVLTSDDVKQLTKKTFNENITNIFFRLRKAWETRLIPIHDAIKQMAKLDPSKKGELQHLDNLYFNEKGKVEEQSLFSMVNGFVDLYGKNNPAVKSLVEILKNVDDLKRLDAYLAAVNSRDIEKPRLSSDGKTLLRQRRAPMPKDLYDSEIASGQAKYATVAKDLNDWANAHLQLLVDSGRLSGDTYTKIVNSRQTYAPLWKIPELIGKSQTIMRSKERGFVNLPAGPQFTKGGRGPIYSPLESLIKNAVFYRAIARRVNLAEQFFSAADELQGGGRIAEEIKGKLKVTKIPDALVRAKLQKLKIDTESIDDEARNNLGLDPDTPIDLGISLYQTLYNGTAEDQTVIHWREGKPVIYKIDDTNLYNALIYSDNKLSAFGKSMVGKLLHNQAKILRAGAILDPRFSLRNIMRDPFSAFVYSHHGFNPLDMANGFIESLTKGKWSKEFHRNAAGFADQMAQDMNSVNEMIKDILSKDKGLAEKYSNRWKNANTLSEKASLAWDITGGGALNLAEKVGHIFEEATRIGIYRKTLNALTDGKSNKATPEQIEIAIREAKDTTLPYHRSGSVGGELNRYVAFLNANLQDLSKFSREHTWEHITSTKFSQNTIMKGIAYHLPLALLTFALGKDDEKIKNLPAWRKAGFWNVNLKGVVGSDWILSIPKTFLIGQIYGSSIETALSWMYKKEPNTVTKWLSGVWEATAPNVLPTGPTPLIENYFNRSIFRGTELESPTISEFQPEYRALPSTSKTAETLAHNTQWSGRLANSPVKIDNLVRGWFGSLGSSAVDILDYGVTALGSDAVPDKQSKEFPEYWPVSALFTSPYTPSDYLRRFYDASKVVDERLKTFNSFKRSQEFDKRRDFYKENKRKINFYTPDLDQSTNGRAGEIAKAKRNLAGITKKMMLIKNSTSIHADEKRKEILKLSARRDKLAERYFKTMFLREDQEEVF